MRYNSRKKWEISVHTYLYEKKQSSEHYGAMFCLEKEEMGTYICLYWYKVLKG